jgi:hypothetical protein
MPTHYSFLHACWYLKNFRFFFRALDWGKRVVVCGVTDWIYRLGCRLRDVLATSQTNEFTDHRPVNFKNCDVCTGIEFSFNHFIAWQMRFLPSFTATSSSKIQVIRKLFNSFRMPCYYSCRAQPHTSGCYFRKYTTTIVPQYEQNANIQQKSIRLFPKILLCNNVQNKNFEQQNSIIMRKGLFS